MPLTKMEHSPTTKSTTTSWTASETRGRTLLRSTPSLERCSPSWCLTGRRREHSLSRSRLEMELPLRGQTMEADQTQVGDFIFYKVRLCWTVDAIGNQKPKRNRITKPFIDRKHLSRTFLWHTMEEVVLSIFMKLELHFIPRSLGLLLVDGFSFINPNWLKDPQWLIFSS